MPNGGNGKHLKSINFKVPPEFDLWFGSHVAGLDRTTSEIIRCSIMLSLPTIVANPSLIDHVRFEDINDREDCQ